MLITITSSLNPTSF